MYGLIGKHLRHSASGRLFAAKGVSYTLYSFDTLDKVRAFLRHPDTLSKTSGLNVTFPYKVDIMAELAYIDPLALRIGAVNTLVKANAQWHGYNTDYYGFGAQYEQFARTGDWQEKKALIIGAGGAAKAAMCWLTDHQHPFDVVSRSQPNCLRFTDLQDLSCYGLIIHATPVGTFPHITDCVPLPITQLCQSHIVFDMVYNPKQTALLQAAQQQGAIVHNGWEMLCAQAEQAWSLWHSIDG